MDQEFLGRGYGRALSAGIVQPCLRKPAECSMRTRDIEPDCITELADRERIPEIE